MTPEPFTVAAGGPIPPELAKMLNEPPHPSAMGAPPSPSGGQQTTAQVAATMAAATATPPPVLDPTPVLTVDLPAGYITSEGTLIPQATVRELNGFDEERLARLDMQKNVAIFVTALLSMAVTDIGGQPPTEMTLRSLLIGDRDALILGIRKATYGNLVNFKLTCAVCENESDINVELDVDVPIIRLDDPLKRVFDVELRHGGMAKVALLTGLAQEAYSENIGKKTRAEIETAMLAKSVVEIDGRVVSGREDDVRRLSAADRETLGDFISARQPGPQFLDIPVHCATCGEEYPISLGLPNMFRL